MLFNFKSKNTQKFFIHVFVILFGHFQGLNAFKHLHSKEHYLECEIDLKHQIDKSCSVIEATCIIYDLHGIDKDTRLVFTNAMDRNFTAVRIAGPNFAILKNDIVEQFPQMKRLVLSYGDIKEINDFAFQHARELRVLDLEENKIEEIKYSTFKGADNLKALDLSSNYIKEVRYEVFETIVELETLKLSGNKLTVLDERTFSALRKLKYLDISRNKIKNIHPLIIRENRQLFHFDISNNPLKELYLQVSSLSFNNVNLNDCLLWKLSLSRSITVTNKTTGIRNLELGSNKLSDLTNVHLDTNIFVQKLTLSENLLENLDGNAPNFLWNVTELDVSKNPYLTRISTNFFKKLTKLRKLDLSATELTLVPKMFASLKQLKHLSLEKNRLKWIDFGIFDGLHKLEKLDLENNRLSELDLKSLKKFVPSLKLIDIESNHFSCDFVQEIVEYLKNNTDLRVIEFSDDGLEFRWKLKSYNGIQCDTVFAYLDYYWYGLILILTIAAVTTIFLIKEDLRTWYTHIRYRTMGNNSSSNEIQNTVNVEEEILVE